MKAKNAALPLLITVILSALGIAYAGWVDQVYIMGTAEMGSMTLAFDYTEPPVVSEFHKIGGEGGLVPGEYLGKEVASERAWYDVLVTDCKTGLMGYKELHIEVNNSYPCLYVYTTFVLRNLGTVPLMVYQYNITAECISSQTGAKVCDLGLVPQAAPGGKYEWLLFEDLDGDGEKDADENYVLWMQTVDGLPLQIDKEGYEKREIDIHFLQPARQCHIYKFRVSVDAIQWNKLYETVPS